MAVEPAGAGPRDDGTIPLIRPTVTAFIGRTEVGPVNEPVRIASLDEFRRHFGGHTSFSFVSQAVEHYFQHGGREAVVVRVANRATRARLEIPAGDHLLRFQAVEPGSGVNLRASVDHERVETQRDKFNLVLQLTARGSGVIRDQEIFSAVSTNPADPRYVGVMLEESKLVRLTGPVPGVRPRPTEARHPGDPLPYVPMSEAGSDGEALTDYDIIGSNEEGTGLFALERAGRVDLICVPPAPGTETGVTSFVAAERYARRRHAMLIWDPPGSWSTVAEAVAAMRTAVWSGRNAVTYFPRIRRRGEAFRHPVGLPACGAVAGAIALSDSCGVWDRRSAAHAALKTSLTPVARLDAREAAALRRVGVNALESAAGGAALKPAVTAAGPGAASLWRDFDRRRLLLFVLAAVDEAAASVVRRLRGARAATRLQDQLEDFLGALAARGAFAGNGPPEACFVRAGERDAAVVRFGIAPTRGGEFASFVVDLSTSPPRAVPLPALEGDQLAS